MGAAAVDTRQVTRTIQVSTTDAFRFIPDALNVRAGESIAFEIRNPGTLPHEFFIGTSAEQLAHEREMASGAATLTEANAVDVPAGMTVRLVYTFDHPGMLEYGCHVPGHFSAGMRGTITVTPA